MGNKLIGARTGLLARLKKMWFADPLCEECGKPKTACEPDCPRMITEDEWWTAIR